MEKDYSVYLKETGLLDFSSPSVKTLVKERGWKTLAEAEKVKAIYDFVKNEILFGYNSGDDIKASRVLKDGYGQCNTKGTLFMALLRACDIPCRVHGFTIDKKLQLNQKKLHVPFDDNKAASQEKQTLDKQVPFL